MGTIRVPIHTAPYVMISSDYSQQEPKLTAFVSGDEKMVQAFKDGKDIYATIASLAFNLPYEKCLEFHPETGEYQPDGKARRGEAKTIVLGITYGRSVPSVGEQLYGTNKEMTAEEKTKGAQKVFDAVLNAFPALRSLMINSQNFARRHGYTETILGRRRHLPDMQLKEFEFKADSGYVNPDVDPLDITTLDQKSDIPPRIVKQLEEEFAGYKYFGQIVRRTKELKEQGIRVINNRAKINDATRQVVNCVDEETEILTTHGWERWNTVKIGDEILAYDMVSGSIVKTHIMDMTASLVGSEPIEMIAFKSPSFDAVTTPEHRWVTSKTSVSINTTAEINADKWSNAHPILRAAGNKFPDNEQWSEDELRQLGWILSDQVPFSVNLSQEKLDTACKDKVLNYDFIFSLSQYQARVLMKSMIEGNGTSSKPTRSITYTCDSAEKKDRFQALCFMGGNASDAKEHVVGGATRWIVKVIREEKAYIYSQHKSVVKKPMCWCVQTFTGTWIARRNNNVYITGNSIIQGQLSTALTH